MKTIGIIGGMSIQSTIHYIEDMTNIVHEKLGGLNSPKIAMSCVNFAEIEPGQRSGDWDMLGDILADHARRVVAAGADFVILATNTMHKVADKIQNAVDVPFLHIADATADAIKKDGLVKIGLLGTSYTMEQDFYKGRLAAAGLDIIVPNAADRKIVNDIIFQELCVGIVRDESRREYNRIIESMIADGATAIILGCTEIGMLIDRASVPLYDTTKIHVAAAVNAVLS